MSAFADTCVRAWKLFGGPVHGPDYEEWLVATLRGVGKGCPTLLGDDGWLGSGQISSLVGVEFARNEQFGSVVESKCSSCLGGYKDGDSESSLEGHVVGVTVRDGGGGQSVGAYGLKGDSSNVSSRSVGEGRVGPNGGISVGRGKNYAKNQEKRARKRAEKQQRQGKRSDAANWRNVDVEKKGAGNVSTIDISLRDSWVERKNAENKLATMKAKQQLALVEARDMDEAKRAVVSGDKKRANNNMVAIEKAFDKLRANGDVPGCATVVTEDGRTVQRLEDGSIVETPALTPGSGSISPDSSASQHEFRKAQKTILDLEAEVAELKKTIKRTKQFEDLGNCQEVAFTQYDGDLSPSVRERCNAIEDVGIVTEYVDEVEDKRIVQISYAVHDY